MPQSCTGACANRIGSDLVLAWFRVGSGLVRSIFGPYPPPLGEGRFLLRGRVSRQEGCKSLLPTLARSGRGFIQELGAIQRDPLHPAEKVVNEITTIDRRSAIYL